MSMCADKFLFELIHTIVEDNTGIAEVECSEWNKPYCEGKLR